MSASIDLNVGGQQRSTGLLWEQVPLCPEPALGTCVLSQPALHVADGDAWRRNKRSIVKVCSHARGSPGISLLQDHAHLLFLELELFPQFFLLQVMLLSKLANHFLACDL